MDDSPLPSAINAGGPFEGKLGRGVLPGWMVTELRRSGVAVVDDPVVLTRQELSGVVPGADMVGANPGLGAGHPVLAVLPGRLSCLALSADASCCAPRWAGSSHVPVLVQQGGHRPARPSRRRCSWPWAGSCWWTGPWDVGIGIAAAFSSYDVIQTADAEETGVSLMLLCIAVGAICWMLHLRPPERLVWPIALYGTLLCVPLIALLGVGANYGLEGTARCEGLPLLCLSRHQHGQGRQRDARLRQGQHAGGPAPR